MEILGLSGYARSGKDTAAEVLVEEYGFTRVAFANKLRDMLYALNPVVHQSWHGTMVGELAAETVYVQDVIDAYGWEEYKETVFGQEIRRLMQRLGTEAGRDILGTNIWVDSTLNGWPDTAKLVVTDCRFLNEAEGVKARGGRVVRITRNGVGPVNDHPSETSLDDYGFDWNIGNTSSLEQFKEEVRYMMFSLVHAVRTGANSVLQ